MDSTDYENLSRDDLLCLIHDLEEERDHYRQRYEDLCWETNRFVCAVLNEHDVDGR